VQNPVEQASKRDEAALAQWKVEGRTALKKVAEEGRTIIFVDESSFYLLPMVVFTYAPSGQTLVLRILLSPDYLSAIRAITPQGRRFFQMYQHSYSAEAVVRFLRLLLRKFPGR
jgi:hypothetical protein